MVNDSWLAAAALERTFGDPGTGAPLWPRAVLEADEQEKFPEAAWNCLLACDYAKELIPPAQGGRLRDAERILLLGRVVSRRDLTVAIATGQGLLGALPVWIGGSEPLKNYTAAILANGGAGALALTEETHGSDLAATEVRATRSANGYQLNGTKWAINNGSRSRFLTVLARTSDLPGPRALSLFLLDKEHAPERSIEPVRKIRTHGIRAADISGASFRATPVPARFLVGKEGLGLELVLKAMQVSRTLCASFSLGAADTALRLALVFARERRLYGNVALALPAVRQALVDSFVRLLLADAVAHLGARALSFAPERMTLYSSVVKLLVPQLCVESIERAATVLGARHYMRDGRFALFQKVMRDASLIGLFDGSAAVNRFVLGTQTRHVALRLSKGDSMASLERARALLNLEVSPPPLDFQAFRIGSPGTDDLLGSLDVSPDRAFGRYRYAPLERERIQALRSERDSWTAAVLAAHGAEDPQSVSALERAETLGWLLAGAACVHLRAAPAGALLSAATNGSFASLALRLVLGRISPGSPFARRAPEDEMTEAQIFNVLLALERDHAALSLAPLPLGDDGLFRGEDLGEFAQAADL